MRDHLMTLYKAKSDPIPPCPSTPNKTSLLSLSLPSPPHDADNVLITLISNYLLHSLTAMAFLNFNNFDTRSTEINDMSTALYDTHTLLLWVPTLSNLPDKHMNSILTRAYTALTKSSTSARCIDVQTATAIYRIRAYGLLCLAHTGTGVLEPTTFWNQVAKFTASFVQDITALGANNEDKDSTVDCSSTIVSTLLEVIEHARRRVDCTEFMSGRGFFAFCEYWASFAKRVSTAHYAHSFGCSFHLFQSNDLPTLQRIRGLMEPAGTSNALKISPSAPAIVGVQQSLRSPKNGGQHAIPDSMVESARLYALFTQATAMLEDLSVSGGSILFDVAVKTNGRSRTSRLELSRGSDRAHTTSRVLPSSLVCGNVGTSW